MHIIDYAYDQEDLELNLTITDASGAIVYTESILGIEDYDDARLTCLEVAKGRGFWPAAFSDDPRLRGKKGGQNRAAKMTPQQRSESASKAARARWAKK
jgi:hypothetical protein